MTPFTFDIEIDRRLLDQTVVDLPDAQVARKEAGLLLGHMLLEDPAGLLSHAEVRVVVRDVYGEEIVVVTLAVAVRQAAGRAKSAPSLG